MITIIDYGVGNLLSISRAFEHCGASVKISDRAEDIQSAERLVLPGVGAFADGMRELNARSLVKPVQEHARQNRPLLGICLGMQMLLETGEEFGEHSGLGIIPGRVVPVPKKSAAGIPHKIPHIGWNGLLPGEKSVAWEQTPLKKASPGAAFYYVHSFHAQPLKETAILGYSLYNGQKIVGAVVQGQTFGFQFHPEKSGPVGLDVIRAFCS